MTVSKPKIIVAPLNWGLGHATRCIPIIKALTEAGFEPIIASDGQAFSLLKKEFPELTSLNLPSYGITYPKNGRYFIWKLVLMLPKIIHATYKEHDFIQKWIAKTPVSGIISDNRFGVRSPNVPSVYITHQIRVISGRSSRLSTAIHQHIIKKFTVCWIPDIESRPNLSGKLGRIKRNLFPIKYIGILSRFEKKELPTQYPLLVILSGPEPQRSLLEEKLTLELEHYHKPVLFIKGIIEDKQIIDTKNHITYYNFMNTHELENAINQSEIVICRSGYTSIMDLAVLQKKAFFIPTPGQFEQEYLARKMRKNGWAPFCAQDQFTLSKLSRISGYSGLYISYKKPDWKVLFGLFERE